VYAFGCVDFVGAILMNRLYFFISWFVNCAACAIFDVLGSLAFGRAGVMSSCGVAFIEVSKFLCVLFVRGIILALADAITRHTED
jgi:hypothetical protein